MPGERTCPDQALACNEKGLTSTQFIFGLLAIVDVGQQAVPSDDFALCIPKWLSPHLEPPEHAVVSSITALVVVRIAALECAQEGVDIDLHVIGVSYAVRRPVCTSSREIPEIVQ